MLTRSRHSGHVKFASSRPRSKQSRHTSWRQGYTTGSRMASQQIGQVGGSEETRRCESVRVVAIDTPSLAVNFHVGCAHAQLFFGSAAQCRAPYPLQTQLYGFHHASAFYSSKGISTSTTSVIFLQFTHTEGEQDVTTLYSLQDYKPIKKCFIVYASYYRFETTIRNHVYISGQATTETKPTLILVISL